jgi:hypothetical protein
MLLTDCDICLNETADLIELPCNHKCCDKCVRKIDKCHMCRSKFNKSEVFKTDIKLKLHKSTVVTVPFYYDTLNAKVDDIQGTLFIMEIEEILSNYGYKAYSSLELDTGVVPVRANIGLSNDE